MKLPDPPLLVITDRRQAAGALERMVASVFEGGCRWLSLREKDLSHEQRLALLERLRPLAKAKDACLMVHDDLSAAESLDGVHLPRHRSVSEARSRLGDRLIGVSAHDLAEAKAAAAAGADYITLSPIFPSDSKPGYGPALGLNGLSEVSRAVEIPVLALGGVTIETAAGCLGAGAAGLVVMGDIMRANDPKLKISDFVRVWR